MSLTVYRSSAGSEECCCVLFATRRSHGTATVWPYCRTPATSVARFDAPSVSRCRSMCLLTLRGNRNELHESGSMLAFVMPRDAEPLAHRWCVGPARGASTVLFSDCRSVSKRTLFCWSCIIAKADAGVHERLAQSCELRHQAIVTRITELRVWLTGVCGRQKPM